MEFDPRGGSLKSQIKRVDKLKARYMLVIGQSERENSKGQLKRMADGQQIPVFPSEIAQTVRRTTGTIDSGLA